MARKALALSQESDVADVNSHMSDKEVYELHNHETAREFPAEKQCQCKRCESHRDSQE